MKNLLSRDDLRAIAAAPATGFWRGGIEPCCHNCIHFAADLFEDRGDCFGPELAWRRVHMDDLCEQHEPVSGITIEWIMGRAELQEILEACHLPELEAPA